jgi:hypothetical protein
MSNRELPRPRVHVEVLVPVIAGGVKRIVHALPRGGLGFLEKHAHVPALVGDRRSSAELLGDRGKQLVSAPSGARHMHDDRGEWHHRRS